MSVFSLRTAACVVAIGLLLLTSCAGPEPVKTGSAEYYWNAAKQAYSAGNYQKTADQLELVIAENNAYTARAIPWYLVVTSGMADGYIKLADRYTAGSKLNKTNPRAFRLKASEYRATANRLALRFAQSVDKIGQVPLGTLPLAFTLPNGNASEPVLLAKIAAGIEVPVADAQAAETQAVQHYVLMSACLAAGAPNDMAKAEEILSQPAAGTSRAIFGNAIAYMLETESKMYTRDKLDEPQKLAIFHDRAEKVQAEAARAGSARFVRVGNVGEARPETRP